MRPATPKQKRGEEKPSKAAGAKTWEEIAAEVTKEKQAGTFNPLPRNIIRPVTLIESNEIGPRTLLEWRIYETKLLERIERVIKGIERPRWEDLFFKKEADFISGIWTKNTDVWRTLIAQMPASTRALVYHLVLGGSDLFLNLKCIDRKEAVRFKKRLICTRDKISERNKEMLQKMPNNPLFWINGRLRAAKVIPKPYEIIRGKLKTLTVPNQEAVRERSDEILQQLKDWCKMGSVRMIEKGKKPWLTAGFILVDRPEKDTRICLNGSIFKPLEHYTFPCKMDSIKTAIQMLKKGDLMCKFDDKKGNKKSQKKERE